MMIIRILCGGFFVLGRLAALTVFPMAANSGPVGFGIIGNRFTENKPAVDFERLVAPCPALVISRSRHDAPGIGQSQWRFGLIAG